MTETFTTDEGRSVPAVTTAEMREVDRVAVEEVGLQLLQMMENAGRTLAGFARELTDCDVVVLAGNGGNGGGGLCAARHLSNHGQTVRVVLDRETEELTGAAATQLQILRGTDATVTTDRTAANVDDAGVVIDAIIGYGLSGPAHGRAAELITASNETSTPTLSLDVPSGMNATNGDQPGPAVDPAHTLTLAVPKAGLRGLSNLWLADIGIPVAVYRQVGIDYTQPFDGRTRVALV